MQINNYIHLALTYSSFSFDILDCKNMYASELIQLKKVVYILSLDNVLMFYYTEKVGLTMQAVLVTSMRWPIDKGLEVFIGGLKFLSCRLQLPAGTHVYFITTVMTILFFC